MSTLAMDQTTRESLSKLNEHGLCNISEHCRKLRSIAHEPVNTQVESHLQLILEDMTDFLDEMIYVHDQLFRLKQQLPIQQRILFRARAQATPVPHRMLSQLDTMTRTLQTLQCAALTGKSNRYLRHIETVCKALVKLRNDMSQTLTELGQSASLYTLLSHYRQAN